MEKRFDSVEERFTHLERRFDELQDTVDAYAKRADALLQDMVRLTHQGTIVGDAGPGLPSTPA